MATQQTIELTQEEKNKFITLIKSVDIQELAIPEGAKRKWFRFGAYDALRALSERILNDGQEKR